MTLIIGLFLLLPLAFIVLTVSCVVLILSYRKKIYISSIFYNELAEKIAELSKNVQIMNERIGMLEEQVMTSEEHW